MTRLLVLVASFALLAVACGSGPDAPPVGESARACLPEFCVDYPSDWVRSEATGALTFVHPLNTDDSRPTLAASATVLDMSAIVQQVGGSWPSAVENVERDFWTLLGEFQDTDLETVQDRDGGGVWSRGRLGDGLLWHALIPMEGSLAIGIEIRVPNRSWDDHARRFIDGVVASP